MDAGCASKGLRVSNGKDEAATYFSREDSERSSWGWRIWGSGHFRFLRQKRKNDVGLRNFLGGTHSP